MLVISSTLEDKISYAQAKEPLIFSIRVTTM